MSKKLQLPLNPRYSSGSQQSAGIQARPPSPTLGHPVPVLVSSPDGTNTQRTNQAGDTATVSTQTDLSFPREVYDFTGVFDTDRNRWELDRATAQQAGYEGPSITRWLTRREREEILAPVHQRPGPEGRGPGSYRDGPAETRLNYRLPTAPSTQTGVRHTGLNRPLTPTEIHGELYQQINK